MAGCCSERLQARFYASLVAVLVGASCARPADRPNVVLISIDTLNRSALAAFDASAPALPRIDALAGESVRFQNALSTASWTLPAHASLLTGLFPDRHGAIHTAVRLPDDVATLAQVFRAAGYRTAAMTGGGFLDEDYGMMRGFETARGRARGAKEPLPPLASLAGDLRSFLESGAADAPFFLFLHTYGVHDYYRLPPEVVAHAAGATLPSKRELADCVLGLARGTPELWRDLERMYRVQVAALDAVLGEVVDELVERGLWDSTIVAVVSDHGEGFDPARERIHHGGRLHADVIRIPLLLRVPGTSGRDEAAPVSLVDVMPTLLELAGVDRPGELDGRSLVPLLSGKSIGERPLYAMEHSFSWTAAGRAEIGEVGTTPLALTVLHDGAWYIRSPAGEEAYDLGADPRQERNRIAELTNVAELRRLAAGRGVARAAPQRAADPQLDEELGDLGYAK